MRDDRRKIITDGTNDLSVSATGAAKVDGSAVTQPVSGTVTANAGTNLNTSLLALDATLTGTTQKSQTIDASGNVWGPRTNSGSVNWMPIINLEGATTGSAVAPRTVQVGGSDGTNLRTMSTDATGRVNVSVGTSLALFGFSASMTKTGIGVTELNALYLKNPIASGKTLLIRSFTVGNIHTVDGSWIRLRVYSNPTSSANGAAVTVGALAVGAGSVAVATPFNTPTTSANGALLYDAVVYSGNSQVFQANGLLSLAANNNLLITVVADAAGRSSDMTLVWEEI